LKQEKITDIDKRYLINVLDNERKNIYQILFISVLMTLTVVFLPKGNRLSLFERYGFHIPFLGIFTILFSIYYYQHHKSLSKIKKDLISELKTIEEFKIIDKNTTLKNEYLVFIDCPIKKIQKHKVEKVEFTKLRIGDLVRVEYFKNSETFLRIIYN